MAEVTPAARHAAQQKLLADEGAGFAAIGATSTLIMDPNQSRIETTIVNDSDTIVYLALGVDAVVGCGVRLNAAGGNYTIGSFTGIINGIHAGAGTKNVTYVEV